MLARKLQHQATSGAASDISASLSVRSMASSRQLAPPPPPWWSKWLGLTAVLHLANTYYASRMVLVTLTSFLSLVLLCVFANKSDFWIWIWMLFQLTNMALGLSALPYIQLFATVPTDTNDADADSQTADTDNNATDDANETKKLATRGASFSFLRSSLYAVEAKLEPFHLQRSTVLRICETIVVVQSVLLYLVLLVLVLTIFVQRERLWHESSVFTTETALGLLAVVCVVVQTKAFDRLRSHEQFQLGVGLDPEQLDPPTNSRRRPGSSDRISIVLQARESRDSLRSRLDSGHSSSTHHDLTPPQSNNSTAAELGHAAGLVEQELRRGLYEAAVARDVTKARALLQVMERVLGSQVKVELLLLKMYATPTLWLWSFAFTTHNPLHVACRLGDDAMVETLLAGGLNPNLLDKTHGAPLSLRLLYDLCQGRGRELTNVLGAPLHVAVAHGHAHLVDKLVQHGASLDVVAQTSWFSRSMRVPAIFLADSSDVLSCLIHHRANFLVVPGKNSMSPLSASTTLTVLQRVKLNGRSDLEAVLKDWGGDVALTPLHEVAAAGDLVTVKHYLSLGIPPDQRGEFQDGVFQRTPLHWASIMGRTAVVRELLAHGSDVHAVDSQGRSPLHWASRHNHVDTVDALLAAGADPHAMDDDGLTPLAFAAEGGLLTSASVELMMNHGVDVNAAMANGAEDTCLHLALRRGHQDAALALLTTGRADLNVANADGLRAIECCASSELQFAVKERSGWVDVVLSFDAPYRALAQRVKEGIEASFLTVFLREEEQGSEVAAPSMDVMREASAVVCVLSPGFERSAACMEELAFAKLLQLPVVALTTEAAAAGLPEELQVYLFTRQLVPLRDAVAMTEDGHGRIRFTIDDAKFQRSVQNLIDGLRDEVERHRFGGRGGGGGAMGSGGDPLEDEDGRDVRSITMSMDVRGTTSSEATSITVATEETKDADAVSLRARMNRTVSPRPSNPSHRSLQDVVRDVVQRRRHQNNQTRPSNSRRTSLFALSSLSVFVSHGDCHSELVAQLCEELRQLDVLVTLDSMAHVSSMKERILAAKDAILSCDVFLVILSKESVQTELVNDQLAFAEDKGKPIVPVHVTKRPSVITSSLRQALDRSGHALHVIADDFTYGRGLDELLTIVRSQPSTVHTDIKSEAAARIAHRLATRAHSKMATTKLHQF